MKQPMMRRLGLFLFSLPALASFAAEPSFNEPARTSFVFDEIEGLNLEALSLNESQNYLLSHHPKMLAQMASEESAKQVYLQAWSAWLPSVKANAAYAQDSLPGHYTAGASVNQTIFENARYWNVRLKKLDWAIAKALVANLKNDLLYELRLSYYGLIVAGQEVKAAEENVDLLQASYEREKSRFELGDTTSFQMNQSRVALSTSLADLYAARALHKKAYQRLYVALGVSPSFAAQKVELAETEIPVASIELIQDLLTKLEADQSKVDLGKLAVSIDSQSSLFSEKVRLNYVDLALEDAPAVRIAKAGVDKNQMTTKSRYGEYLPSLSASASYNNNYSRGKSGPFEGDYKGAVGLSLEWTLVDGFAREKRIAQARWDRLAAHEQLRHLTHQTRQSVLGSFYELEEALQTYVASKMSVKLAQDAMEQADHQRTWGVISPLEYREAASLLTRSRRDFAKSGYQLIQAYYLLVYNTGQDVASDYVQVEEVIQQADHSKK